MICPNKIKRLPKNFAISKATIIDPLSKYHTKSCDIIVENGIIHNISTKSIKHRNKILENVYVSPSWIDIGTHVCDPGYEHRETKESATLAATLGGFSLIAVFPNTKPAVDNKQLIQYLTADNENRHCKILPIASITTSIKGEKLCNMIELQKCGAIAFSDGYNSIENPDILLKTLQYLLPLNATIIQSPKNTILNQGGVMNEGKTNAMLGMKGMPYIAESSVVNRDLIIQKYSNGKIHFHQISSENSAKTIANQVKKNNNSITCDVTANHLYFTDENLINYDTNYKVNPPFRTEKDKKYLINAVKKNIITCITTGHRPCEIETKNVAFEEAEYGMIGLQTYLNTLLTVFKTPENLPIMQMAHNPRKILGLNEVIIKKNAPAELTIYDPKRTWKYDDSTNASLSSNSPLLNQKLTGMVIGGVNRKNAWVIS